jgi:hypothetical protein
MLPEKNWTFNGDEIERISKFYPYNYTGLKRVRDDDVFSIPVKKMKPFYNTNQTLFELKKIAKILFQNWQFLSKKLKLSVINLY